MNPGPARHQPGFTLIELSVLMVIIGMVLLVAALAIPSLTERARLDNTNVTIDEVAAALVSFAAINSRLPCPDTSASPNGLEGSGAMSGCDGTDVAGRVPYRELGLADPVLDQAHLPVRYAVYRNPDAVADLADVPVGIFPVLPGDPPTLSTYTGLPDDPVVETPTKGINPDPVVTNVINDLDFCLVLRNAKASAASTSYVHTLDLGGAIPSFNAAFVLVSGGVEDADGDAVDLAFDGVNEDASQIDFESPARRRSDSAVIAQAYDDLVFAMPFGLLESKISCAAITIAVTSAANVAIAAAHSLVHAEDGVWAAELHVTMATIAVATSSFSVAMAAITDWVAANDIAAATAGCVALIPTACTAEPFAIAAGVLAGISTVAAGATVVLTAIALSEANDADTLAKSELKDVHKHTTKTRLDALAADARGGQM